MKTTGVAFWNFLPHIWSYFKEALIVLYNLAGHDYHIYHEVWMKLDDNYGGSSILK